VIDKETAVKTAIRSALAAALVFLGATSTLAHCIVGTPGSNRAPVKGLTPQVAAFAAAAAAASPSAGDNGSIVGLWTVSFHVGDSADIWDAGFEQWHADGTEFTMDTAVPPAAGNVCVGVWARAGARGAKLHHVGWNWDISVSPAALAGVFVLDMTVELGPDGHTFTGHYVTDSYDNDGNVIPEFHAEGLVTATRITPNSTKW
jgi:hypothetical protein